MLEKLANKIEELVKQGTEPQIEEIEGVLYEKTYRGYTRINMPHPDVINVNSLSGIVRLIKEHLKRPLDPRIPEKLLINVDFNNVTVLTDFNRSLERYTLFKARPMIPSLDLDMNLSVEELIIKLTTAYVQTDNTDRFIKSLSSLRMVEEVEFNDSGIGQSVIAKQSTSTNVKYEVTPIVKLVPIRTYSEIEQVESKFLFRVNKNGSVILREADGGQYKYIIQQRITKFLYDVLSEEVGQGKLSIIG